ncbi:MAG: calcium-binding protein, partial [Siculibacillus sp.]
MASTGHAAGDVVTTINRPAAGAIQVVEVPPGSNLKFNFATGDAKVIVLDVDLVLLFPDGGKVIIPGFAFDLVGSDSSEVTFLDKLLTSQQLLARVGEVKLMDDTGLQTVGSQGDTDGKKKGADSDEEKKEETPAAEPMPTPTPPAPAAPGAKLTGVADFDKPPEDAAEASPRKTTDAIASPPASGSPPAQANSNTSNDDGNVTAAKLIVSLYGVSGIKTSTLNSGGQEIRGAAAILPASTDKTYAVQQTPESITGTALGDVIYADDPAQMPAGTNVRLIDVEAILPGGGTADYAIVTNLPTGFAINNAVKDGDRWIVQLDSTRINHFQLELRYVLPTDGTVPDANGFLGSFALNVQLIVNSGGTPRIFTGSQTFMIGEVASQADVELLSQDGKSKIYVLNATPPGNVIDAGGGDDTVHAGSGHDTIDGGAGFNVISYEQSGSGVTVDLEHGTGTGGWAAGDVLTNFTSVIGSAFADTLIGSSGNNTFFGSGGADTIIGGGGIDTVDYSASTVGVDVDLSTGIGVGGLADGDRLTGIADLVGSATAANRLTGNTGVNVLTGGAAGDTIDGRGGLDVIRAGGGADTVVYRGGEASIAGDAGSDTLILTVGTAVDLAASDQTVGDGAAVTGFENVDAALLSTGITISGSVDVNTLVGSQGADTIDGAGGGDAISAGTGDDRVTYHGGETSIDGGIGVDTLVMLAEAAVDLTAADQTTGDVTVVSSFQNVDGSTLDSTQTLTVLGSSAANAITGGLGADTIDGGGGVDTISAGGGADTVAYRGTEASVDGGTGINTLQLKAAAVVDLAASADQTSGDAVTVVGFRNIDATALTDGATLTGDVLANTITGGAGADTIGGGGGADVIAAGAGDDAVKLEGNETSIDGGTGTDTLVLELSGAISAINLAGAGGADQTIGDTTTVTRFENVDGGALSAAQSVSISGSIFANSLIGGAGADTIDGAGGSDVVQGGDGDDRVSYYGTEISVEGGSGINELVLTRAITVDLGSADQTSGDLTAVSRFVDVDASTLGVSQAVALTGSSADNRLTGGGGADTIDGAGGSDVIAAGGGDDAVRYWGGEASIDGGTGINTLVLKAAVTVDLAAADQTVGDGAITTGFVDIDASGLTAAQSVSLTGSSGLNVILGG